jgi:hypothetical protein
MMERLLEGLITDVTPEPDPLLAHSRAPCVALRTGNGQTLEKPFQKEFQSVSYQANRE